MLDAGGGGFALPSILPSTLQFTQPLDFGVAFLLYGQEASTDVVTGDCCMSFWAPELPRSAQACELRRKDSRIAAHVFC